MDLRRLKSPRDFHRGGKVYSIYAIGNQKRHNLLSLHAETGEIFAAEPGIFPEYEVWEVAFKAAEQSRPVLTTATDTTVAQEAIRTLLAMGYAVVVYTPEELRGVERSRLETVMMTRGDEFINETAHTRNSQQASYVEIMRGIISGAYENSPNDYAGFLLTILNALEKLNARGTFDLPDVVGNVLAYLNDAEDRHTPTVASAAAKKMLEDWINYEGDYRD